jgi:tRNA(Glu) U13 pseudouridine synthase TruD
MCIEAWQSHLWNDAVRRFLERTAKGPLLRSDDRFGPFLFPRARDLHPLLRKTLIGLPAPDTELQQPWRDDLLAAVAAEGATLEALRVPELGRPRFSNAKRSLFMRIDRWRLEDPVPDETSKGPGRFARTLRLELPRGSYATVVLRALGQ